MIKLFQFACVVSMVAVMLSCSPSGDESDSLAKIERITVELPGGVPMEFVKIPAGKFVMGTPETEKDHEPDEEPLREITLASPFYLGVYEVTQKQWMAVMGGDNPSQFTGENRPVEEVSWDDCRDFAQKISGLDQGTFRLPTEAEWEYACRAGTTTAFFWGNDLTRTEIDNYAWYEDNADKQTHEVGLKKPNPWGLYDICGNVYEWCLDWHEKPYQNRYLSNPKGPKKGKERVRRGGNWTVVSGSLRSGNRFYAAPTVRSPGTGFRLYRNYP